MGEKFEGRSLGFQYNLLPCAVQAPQNSTGLAWREGWGHSNLQLAHSYPMLTSLILSSTLVTIALA